MSEARRARAYRASSLLVCAVVAVLLATSAAPAARSVSPRDASTILVRFATPTQAGRAIAAEGDRHLGDAAARVAVVEIAPHATVDQKISEYSARSDVVYAEPNYVAHAYLGAPNDPSFGSQWAYQKIQAVSGWSIYPGSYASSGGATLAVVDTGVQAGHPDLGARVQSAAGATCLTGTCVASLGTDDNGHGTHVAGIAGATTNNAVGVAGTAFTSPIVPVKVLDSSGSGTYASVASGILWAAQHGARAINLSLGGTGFSQTLCDAVTTATVTYHAVVIAAAGNAASSVPSYPAACSGAVGVAATDSADARATFSNFGSPNVFLSAPGASIYSTYLGSTYRNLSGTSMAAPFVTGLVALLAGQSPSLTPAALKQRLAQTSDKVGAGAYGADPYGTCTGCTWNASYGYGRINVARALNLNPAPTPNFTLGVTPSSRTVTVGGGTTYSVSVTPSGGFAGAVTFSVSGLPAGATALFSPNPGTTSSTLTVGTSSSTPARTSTLTIAGTSGGLVRTVSTLLITQTPSTIGDFALSASPTTQNVDLGNTTTYSISVAASGGFNAPVSFTVAGLPSAVSGSFNPNPGTTGVTLTIATSVMASTGTYSLTVTGTSGGLVHSTAVTLVVRSNYSLSASPSSQTVVAGAGTTYNVAVTRYGGFAGAVNLSVSGLPSGATASFTPNPATGTSTMLTVATTAGTPRGSYVLTITGVAGSRLLTHTASVTLVVS